MDEFLQQVYLREVLVQCEWALAAVNEMNAALRQPSNGMFFRSAHNLLQHTAIASRLLWPPDLKNKRVQRRGTALCASLRIDANSGASALQKRDLRDLFEHYDEHVDAWAATSPNRNIVSDMIGPRSAIGGSGITDGDIMRAFDPATKTLWFRGQTFDVQQLVDGIVDLRARSDARIREIDELRRTRALASMRRSVPPGSGKP